MAVSASIKALFDLRGRVAVVTGASAGIGRAMAGFLADAGASVILVARREAELESTAAEIRQCDGTVLFASAASNYITGQTLYIDGGFTAR